MPRSGEAYPPSHWFNEVSLSHDNEWADTRQRTRKIWPGAGQNKGLVRCRRQVRNIILEAGAGQPQNTVGCVAGEG